MGRHAVTGAFGFSEGHIAARLLDAGHEGVTLTNHPDRPDPFDGAVGVRRLAFDDASVLRTALEGVDTLYNTYWVRYARSGVTHATAVRNSAALWTAASDAGVRRIVHVSIANPSPASPLPYYRGKAQVEASLSLSGMSHAILRPTVLFGDEPILVNTIAWLLRRLPVFGIPADGRYGVQPVHVADLAALAVTAGERDDDLTWDVVGPEIFGFEEWVATIRDAVGAASRLVRVPGPVALAAAAVAGRVLGDTLLTRDELDGLRSGLLVSRELPRGTARFSEWVAANGAWLGRRHLSEVDRHFIPASATAG